MITDARNLSANTLASEDGDLFSAQNPGFFRQTVPREDLDSFLADGATLNQDQ